MRTPYPRTPHLPWSPGATADDVRVAAAGLAAFGDREVVVTEKLDGENTTLYRDGLHARSLDSGHHPSRAWVKALHGRIAHAIPTGHRVCGENLYARHSIAYGELDAYFYAFSVWSGDRCLSWDDTVAFARTVGVPTPRVLWRGRFDERALRRLRLDTDRIEGYVVRTADGFGRAEFGERIAKWVRPGHVRTGTHWMHAPVVPNGLGRAAPLWDVRSGAAPDAPALRAALDEAGEPGPVHDAAARDAAGRLDLAGRTGETRLTGVLAALLHDRPRARLAAALAPAAGMPAARRTADAVGLHRLLHRPFPDELRRDGLVRLAASADLAVLHAVAASTAATADEAEAVEWSALFAEDAADTAAQRALAGRWRPRPPAADLVILCGPSGSGKSRFATGLAPDALVSLDALRSARGSRADQSANAAVHREALTRLGTALSAPDRTVVWDATCLNAHQRAPVEAVAARRGARVTHAVFLVGEAVLARRNDTREHPVPAPVLAAQLRRFDPPYAGRARRTWYIGANGTMDDTAEAPAEEA